MGNIMKNQRGNGAVVRFLFLLHLVSGRMQEIAEEYLGENIKDAAISVPAYFNDAQRQATKDAGSLVGLKVTQIIDEPEDAAIAYDLDKKEEKTNILVYNLGDHSFDVSILTVDNGVVEVLSTNGDTHLGGEDFDRRVTDYFVELIKNMYNKDITKDKRALLKLRRECERANIALSSQQEYRVEIESVFHEIGFSEALTRARFEELNMDLFKKTLGSVKKALEDAGLNESDIDEIVLVGGSTQIPKVQQLLKDLFDGNELERGINPDEIIVYGAAVQAGKENKGLEVTGTKTRKCVVHELGRASSIDAGRVVHVKAKVKGIRKLDHKTMEIPESILKDDEKSSRKIRKVKNKALYKLKNYILYIFFAINYKQVLLADDAPIYFEEKETMEKVLIKTLRWLRDNEMATENEIQEKGKQVDAVFHPIIEQFHAQL